MLKNYSKSRSVSKSKSNSMSSTRGGFSRNFWFKVKVKVNIIVKKIKFKVKVKLKGMVGIKVKVKCGHSECSNNCLGVKEYGDNLKLLHYYNKYPLLELQKVQRDMHMCQKNGNVDGTKMRVL